MWWGGRQVAGVWCGGGRKGREEIHGGGVVVEDRMRSCNRKVCRLRGCRQGEEDIFH